jgi:hypothetical protein
MRAIFFLCLFMSSALWAQSKPKIDPGYSGEDKILIKKISEDLRLTVMEEMSENCSNCALSAEQFDAEVQKRFHAVKAKQTKTFKGEAIAHRRVGRSLRIDDSSRSKRKDLPEKEPVERHEHKVLDQ